MEGLISIAFLCLCIYLVYKFTKKSGDRRDAERAPEEPFKVDVTVVPIQDSLLRIVRGRALTHKLEVKVRIGLKDWQRIKDAGLYDAILFDYPDATSTFSDKRGQYCVCHLREDGAAVFYNIGDAYAAKEKLIHSLQELRQAIEVQKEGPQREVMEI